MTWTREVSDAGACASSVLWLGRFDDELEAWEDILADNRMGYVEWFLTQVYFSKAEAASVIIHPSEEERDEEIRWNEANLNDPHRYLELTMDDVRTIWPVWPL